MAQQDTLITQDGIHVAPPHGASAWSDFQCRLHEQVLQLPDSHTLVVVVDTRNSADAESYARAMEAKKCGFVRNWGGSRKHPEETPAAVLVCGCELGKPRGAAPPIFMPRNNVGRTTLRDWHTVMEGIDALRHIYDNDKRLPEMCISAQNRVIFRPGSRKITRAAPKSIIFTPTPPPPRIMDRLDDMHMWFARSQH